MVAKDLDIHRDLEEGDLSLDDPDMSGLDDVTSIKFDFDEEEELIELLEEDAVDDDDGVDFTMKIAMKMEESPSEITFDQTDSDDVKNMLNEKKPDFSSNKDGALTVGPDESESQSDVMGNEISLDTEIGEVESAEGFPQSQSTEAGSLVSGMGKELLLSIQHELVVELGRVRMSGFEIAELTYGSVVELEKIAGDPVDLVMQGKVVAYGEIVLINHKKLGIRIIGINQD